MRLTSTGLLLGSCHRRPDDPVHPLCPVSALTALGSTVWAIVGASRTAAAGDRRGQADDAHARRLVDERTRVARIGARLFVAPGVDGAVVVAVRLRLR